jgi:DNA polymerase I-like protein with 3'-5' exonuclease and polymerase domains
VSAKQLLEEISRVGIRVDVEAAARRANEFLEDEGQALEALDRLVDFPALKRSRPTLIGKHTHFNPRSPNHINAYVLDNELADAPLKSVRKDVIDQLLPGEVGAQIMRSRQSHKAAQDLGTLRNYTSMDERIHVQWTQAATGRWYTGKPPIQTMSRECRRYLIPDEGNAFYVLDWSQQELRILAHVSQDPVLLDAFERNLDPHIITFERVSGVPVSEDPADRKSQRDIGKLLNYALIYGQDANGLSANLRISPEQAGQLIDAHFKAFPRLSAWRDEQKQQVRERGWVLTLDGHRIDIDLEEGRGKADRKAVNYAIQGTAARQLEQTLGRIATLSPAGHPMISMVRATIHDALLIEAPEGEVGQDIAKWFKLVMEQPFESIITPVDIKGPSPSWLAAMQEVEDAEEVPA